MPVGSAAAGISATAAQAMAAFAKQMGTQAAVKTTKNSVNMFKELRKAGDSGAINDAKDLFSSIESIAPIAAALKLFFAEIQVGTIDNTIDLMNQMIILFKSQGFGTAVEKLILLINVMLDVGVWIVEMADKLLEINDRFDPNGRLNREYQEWLDSQNADPSVLNDFDGPGGQIQLF